MSRTFDDHPEIYELVLDDLIAGGIDPDVGSEGMSAEQVIRLIVIKQMNRFSYNQLAFHGMDSDCYRSFCRVGYDQVLDKNTLQRNGKKVRAETLEAINRIIVLEGKARGVERGRTVRTDCTVEETNIHEPSDSTLLFDVVHVLGPDECGGCFNFVVTPHPLAGVDGLECGAGIEICSPCESCVSAPSDCPDMLTLSRDIFVNAHDPIREGPAWVAMDLELDYTGVEECGDKHWECHVQVLDH